MRAFRRILTGGVAAIGLLTPAHATEDARAVIARDSQAFSDASASGRMSTVARYLDDRVVFINEDGTVTSRADLIKDRTLPTDVTQTLSQTDLDVRLFGETAVTSFTDVSTAHVHGQTIVSRFLSTETWLHEDGDWKMIQSQTLALGDDPPPVVLAGVDLDAYAGAYHGGPNFDVVVRRSGDELTVSTNGGPATPLEAEARDVFFSPGQFSLRRIFQRDASGGITGFITRRNGHDFRWQRSGDK